MVPRECKGGGSWKGGEIDFIRYDPYIGGFFPYIGGVFTFLAHAGDISSLLQVNQGV